MRASTADWSISPFWLPVAVATVDQTTMQLVRLSPAALLDHARTDDGRKQLRYAAISVVFVPLGQVLLQVFAHTIFDARGDTDTSFTKASLLTAAILTLPNFYANKRFVWRDANSDRLRSQVIVFWVAAMLGVTFSTLLTLWVERLVKGQNEFVESVAVFFAQLTGFGIVWVGRYLVLDRWLFKVTHHGAEPTPEELDELHRELPI